MALKVIIGGGLFLAYVGVVVFISFAICGYFDKKE